LTTTKMVLDARAGPHAASINWLPCKPLKCLLLESVQPQNRVATGISLLYLLVEWQVVHLCRNSSAIIGGGHGLLKGCQIACSVTLMLSCALALSSFYHLTPKKPFVDGFACVVCLADNPRKSRF
jgi:hypothetical protein